MRRGFKLAVAFAALLAVGILVLPVAWAQEASGEAPMLRELVSQGSLPPLEERLPKNPHVREVVSEIGQYGGTWYSVHLQNDLHGFWGYASIKPTVLDGISGEFYPQLIEDLVSSDDGRKWVMQMREGLRFSDGELYDADDIMYWWNDVILNEDLAVGVPGSAVIDGQPPRVTKLDQWAVEFAWDDPNPLFHVTVSNFLLGHEAPLFAEHYMRQFHAKYRDKAELDKEVSDRGFENWTQLHQHMSGDGGWEINDPGRPTLYPWMTVSAPTGGPIVSDRNPYYWVVDTAGNQLPYVDRRVLEFVNDIETIKLRALGGDITAGQVPDGVGILPQLLAKREAGELQVQVVGHGGDEQLDLEFNRTHEDPVLAEIFQNPQFSIAVSHAINREEINRVDYLGLATPMQFGPKEGSPVYSEAFKTAYIEYDPAKANRILDEIGLSEKDRDGFRLRPDGKTFEIVLYNTRADTVPEATHELVADYFNDIGIKTTMKRQNRGWDTLTRNDWEAMLGSGHRANGAYFYTVRSAAKFIPYVNNLDRQGSYPAYWSGQWNIWLHTEGAAGVRPPQVVFDINDWAGKMMAATTEDEKKEWARMIIEAGHENMWAIGILGKGPSGVFVADATVGNFYDLNNPPTEWRYNVDQLYIKG